MREINATYTKKQTLLRQQEKIHFNTIKCKTLYIDHSKSILAEIQEVAIENYSLDSDYEGEIL